MVFYLLLIYIDISVLENYHIAQTYKVLSNDEFNIFESLSPEEYRLSRMRIIDAILATDMTYHNSILSTINAKTDLYDIKQGKNLEKVCSNTNDSKMQHIFDDQQLYLNFFIHSSDISNGAKPDKISELWTKKVYDEFFIQGDLEKAKGLPISALCDRATTNVSKAMIGFLTYIVLPNTKSLVNIVPDVSDYYDYCKNNLYKYKLKFKDYEKSLKKVK